MSARENVHLTPPPPPTPAYFDTEAKFSSQTQRRKCAPTANLGTQITAFCTPTTFCTPWSKPVAEFRLQNWLIPRVLHTTLQDQALPRHETSVLLTLFFHLVLSSTFRLSKEIHAISPSNIAVHVNCTQVTLVQLTKLFQVPVFYSRFILHSPFNSVPYCTQQNKNEPKTFQLRNSKMEIKRKKKTMKCQSE